LRDRQVYRKAFSVTLLIQRAVVSGKSATSGSGASIENSQKAMLGLGNKYSPIDGQLAAAAVSQHRAGMPWSEINTTMDDASPAMQRAYEKWKSACDRSEK
jgi:hypothetical protein